MKGIFRIVLPLITTFLCISCEGQTQQANSGSDMRVVSYNVENLFDTSDDPNTDDSEFLPDGALHWTQGKLNNKLDRISWVLSNINGWDYPDIVGLIEIENEQVISELVSHNHLAQHQYHYAVTNAADPRGIDVAMLWSAKRFKKIDAQEIPHYGQLMHYPLGRDKRSKRERDGSGRNTLWVTLQERTTGAMVEVFVVHSPSRRGGAKSTMKNRQRVLGKLAQVVEKIQRKHPERYIIILGDFNDNPNNHNITQTLQAHPLPLLGEEARKDRLYNLAAPILGQRNKGTHYFERSFWVPDQIIVSGNLLQKGGQMHVVQEEMQIFSPDELWFRGRPNRSFSGSRHTGGYSDHFPVYVDIRMKQQ